MAFVLNMFGRPKSPKDGESKDAHSHEEESFELLPDEDYFRMLEAQGRDPTLHTTTVFSMDDKDKAHLKWTANSIDKAKGILLQIGARKWVHFIPFSHVPRTSKLLADLMARAELNRHIWIPTLDLNELNLYRTYALQPEKVRELEHIPQRWEKLFGLGIASEKFRDDDMVEAACRALGRSAACVNYYYPAMMGREHVEYVFLQTTEDSRVRGTLIKLACRVGNGWDFILSFNGPREFLVEAGTFLKKYAGTKYLDPDLDEYSIFGSSNGGSSPERMAQLNEEGEDKKPLFSREGSPRSPLGSGSDKKRVDVSTEKLEALQAALAAQQQEVRQLKTGLDTVASWQKKNEQTMPDTPEPTPLFSPNLISFSPPITSSAVTFTPNAESFKSDAFDGSNDDHDRPPPGQLPLPSPENYAACLTPPSSSPLPLPDTSKSIPPSGVRSQIPISRRPRRRHSTAQPGTVAREDMHRRLAVSETVGVGLEVGVGGGFKRKGSGGLVVREKGGRQLRPRGAGVVKK